jgi:hypothetical protein
MGLRAVISTGSAGSARSRGRLGRLVGFYGGRVNGEDLEREARHHAWLQQPENANAIVLTSVEMVELHGRGYWATSLTDDPPRPVDYRAAATLDDLPDGLVRSRLSVAVKTYNSRTEAVVVVEDDGVVSLYRLLTVRPEEN